MVFSLMFPCSALAESGQLFEVSQQITAQQVPVSKPAQKSTTGPFTPTNEDDPYEENDTLATAYTLANPDTWLSSLGALGIQADDDWYAFDVTDSSARRILAECQFNHAEGDIDLTLVNAAGDILDISWSVTDNESIDFTVLSTGTYYLLVNYGDTGSAYDLKWQAVDSTLPDLAPSLLPGWDNTISLASVAGASGDDEQPLPANQPLYLDLSMQNTGSGPASGSFIIRIFRDGVAIGESLPINDLAAGAFVSTSDFPISPLVEGTYTFSFLVDANDQINESNEINNIYSRTIVIGNGEPIIRIDPLTVNFPAAPQNPTNAGTLSVTSSSIDGPANEIHLKSGRLGAAPLARASMEEIAMTSSPAQAGASERFLIQFNRKLSASEKSRLEQVGIRLHGYLPHNAHWATIDASARTRLMNIEEAGGIRWMREVRLIDRMAPQLRQKTLPPHAQLSDGRMALRLVFFEDVARQAALEELTRYQGTLIEWSSQRTARVILPPANLELLAKSDLIEWVEMDTAPRTNRNATAAQRINVEPLNNAPYNLDGSGVSVGVWDAGLVDQHPDFDNRLTQVDSGSIDSHATHVAGTIGASGAGDPSTMGMAPAVTLRSYDWNSDTQETRSSINDGVRLTNHSYGFISGWHWDGEEWVDYGDSGFGLYSSETSEWDDIVYDTGMLIFWAAGNDRNDGPDYPNGPDMDGPYDTVGQVASAKNLITIGATDDADGMINFSSWGPANDGRVKPDLVANGASLYSTTPNGTYGFKSGTSMATPSACGAGALLHQLHSLINSSDLEPETGKALLVHCAADLGRTGPDYEFGWGLIDALASAQILINGSYVEAILTQGNTDSWEINVPQGAGQLKITLVWTDPAGSPASAIALVNDLDLSATSPSAATALPWTLAGLGNPTALATPGVNSVDTVEQIVVDAPESGTWILNVNGNGITTQNAQPYTLVCEFITGEEAEFSIFTIFNDGSGLLTISDMALDTEVDWLQWSPQAPFSIPAGQSVQVVLTAFMAQAPSGTNLRRLLVSSDDSGNSPYPDGVYIQTSTEGQTIVVYTIEGDFDAGFTLNWSGEPGYTYQVKTSNSLDDPTWTNIGPLFQTDLSEVFTFSDSALPPGIEERYYLIDRQPVP
jgi:hypothetical protein